MGAKQKQASSQTIDYVIAAAIFVATNTPCWCSRNESLAIVALILSDPNPADFR